MPPLPNPGDRGLCKGILVRSQRAQRYTGGIAWTGHLTHARGTTTTGGSTRPQCADSRLRRPRAASAANPMTTRVLDRVPDPIPGGTWRLHCAGPIRDLSVHDPQGTWAASVAVFPVGLLFFDADTKLVGAFSSSLGLG
jgi:hypothetical protein